MTDPWNSILQARDSLSTSKNYLGDAIGALMDPDLPVTKEQVDERRTTVETRIRDAERELERAKRRLGIDDEDGGSHE